jgi:hypothetical protein
MTSFAAELERRESRIVRFVRRAMIAVACIYAVIFSWSMYRRIWQVLHIEARATSLVLRPGSAVGYDVVTSGETNNRIRLELVQDSHSAVLNEQRASVNRVSALDPRVFRYTPTIIVTAALLSGFHRGPATLRVTGFGGQKLLHTPAPRIHELHVGLEP